jgi:hypothetical protein
MQIDAHVLMVAAAVMIVLVLIGRFSSRRKGGPTAPRSATPAPPRPAEGGWKALAAHWPAAAGPERPIARRATIGLGMVRWKNCVRVGADPRGLALEVAVPLLGRMGTRPVKLPWSALGEGEETRLYGRAALRIPVGTPAIATLVVPTDLWRLVEAARRSPVPPETEAGAREIPGPP